MTRLSHATITSILRASTKASRSKSLFGRMFALGVIVVLIMLAINVLPGNDVVVQPEPIPTTIPAGSYVVERVVDGDTIVVAVGEHHQVVRLIGIDTPEVVDPRKPVQCFGSEASQKLRGLLQGNIVRLESDPTQDNKDKYQRWLRYVYLPSGTNINLLMIEQGFAYEYTYGTPYVQQAQFKQAQQLARQREAGLWSPSTCNGQKKLP